jgi:Uma2 family endonuclease
MAAGISSEVVTPEQLAIMSNGEEFELVQGQLVRRNMGNRAASVAAELLILLGAFVRANKLGMLFSSDAGYRLDPKRPDNLRRPDVSFIRSGRLPNDIPSETYDGLAPDLAVEVVSPTDTSYELDRKVEEYLQAGVRLVWVVHPSVRRIDVFRPNRTITALRLNDELTGEDVVPGFRCRVADLFAYPPADDDV